LRHSLARFDLKYRVSSSIKQKFIDRDRTVGFRGDGGYANESFEIADETTGGVTTKEELPRQASLGLSGSVNCAIRYFNCFDFAEEVSLGKKMALDRKIQSLTNGHSSSNKTPLEKSLSMPDMQTRVKKRQRVLA
jgi:hypothetical protein